MRKGDFKTLKRLLNYMGGYQWLFLLGILLTAATNTLIQFLFARALGSVTLVVSASRAEGMAILKNTVLLIGFGYLGISLLGISGEMLTGRAAARFNAHLRRALFHGVLRMPLRKAEGGHSADILSRLNNDVDAARDALTGAVQWTLVPVLAGVGCMVYMFALSWEVAAFLCAACLLDTLVAILFIKPLRRAGERAQAALGAVTEKFADILAGAQIVRMFLLGPAMAKRLGLATAEAREATVRRVRLEAMQNLLSNLFGTLSFVGTIAFSVWMIALGRSTLGDMVMVIQLGNMVSWMFTALSQFLARLQAALAGADRVFALIDEPDEGLSYGEAKPAPEAEMAVECAGLSVAYDGEAVVKGLDLRVKRDETVAIVGPSGGGKSTVLKAILQFAPYTGEMRLFGRAAQEYDLQALREQIAYVPQDTPLFADTIGENIRLGRPGASTAEVEQAARLACLHDFIAGLPAGYDTTVGERGASLSGGQRQRVAIARAFLKDAPILLLDEATSALDSESEAQVQEALSRLMRDRTILVVAHRLSTVRDADRIVVLEGGRKTEEGTHEELLKRNGEYRRLFDLQFAG